MRQTRRAQIAQQVEIHAAEQGYSHDFLGRFRCANCLSGSYRSSVIDVRRAIAHCMVLGTSIPSALSQASATAAAFPEGWSGARSTSADVVKRPDGEQHPLLLLSCCLRYQHPIQLPSQ